MPSASTVNGGTHRSAFSGPGAAVGGPFGGARGCAGACGTLGGGLGTAALAEDVVRGATAVADGGVTGCGFGGSVVAAAALVTADDGATVSICGGATWTKRDRQSKAATTSVAIAP